MSKTANVIMAVQGALERDGFDPNAQDEATRTLRSNFLCLAVELGPDAINPTVLDNDQSQGE